MNIFVGCSSRDTYNPIYNDLATDVGNFIAAENHTLVFGGCAYGLMGKVYSTVAKNNGNVIVTISKAYEDDAKSLTCNEIYLYDTVSERKNGYTSISDMLIFLPGGIGTIDEILTAIETRRSKEHRLPIIIINVNHFFDNLVAMLNRIYGENFADSKDRLNYYVFHSFEDAKDYITKLRFYTRG